jgi:hypothetical protein
MKLIADALPGRIKADNRTARPRDALDARPKRRKPKRKNAHAASLHDQPEPPESVEIGFPFRLAKLCVTLQPHTYTSRERTLERLLADTIENLKRLERIPREEVRQYSQGMTEFPMLVSLRTTQKAIRDFLGPNGVDLAGVRGPGHRFYAHWKADYIARFAEECVYEFSGGVPPSISLDRWKHFVRPNLRELIKNRLSREPKLIERLGSTISAEDDHDSPGVLKDRVIERLLDKSQAFFGLKAMR